MALRVGDATLLFEDVRGDLRGFRRVRGGDGLVSSRRARHLDANGSVTEDHGVETERLDRLRVGFELDESELVLGACDATFDNLAAEGEELAELVDGDE